MQIEEVIAIAKTLNPEFWQAVFIAREKEKVIYSLEYDYVAYSGTSWEEALRNAGWKGKLPEDKCGGDGTYPTVT